MASPITLRLDEETRRRLTRIAKRKQTTTSHALREAIEAWIEREESCGSVYDSIKDLVGTVHGRDPGRSEGGGRRVAQMLKERRSRS